MPADNSEEESYFFASNQCQQQQQQQWRSYTWSIARPVCKLQ